MLRGVIEHTSPGKATVRANDPTPLLQAVHALAQEYGWVVDFEEPPYQSKYDLVDAASPEWHASHPNGPFGKRLAGGEFHSTYNERSSTQSYSTWEEAVLQQVVSDYTSSGNPGRFEVRKETDQRYAIVGVAVTNDAGVIEATNPLLDTVIFLPTETRTVGETLDLILKLLPEAVGGVAIDANFFDQPVTVGGTDVPARVLILQTLTRSGVIWEMVKRTEGGYWFRMNGHR